MFSRAALPVALAAVFLLGSSAPARAEDPFRLVVTRLDASAFPELRVVVRVTDTEGRAVRGLGTGDIQVHEGGQAQRIDAALTAEVAPVNLVLALDVSGSMEGEPLAAAQAAIISMIGTLGPQDQAALVIFDHIARVSHPLTSDKAALIAATQRAAAAGNTAIYDALALSLDVLDPIASAERRAIVILTDGTDTASSALRDDVASRANQGGIPIYAVGYGGAVDRPGLQALADASANGGAYIAPDAAELRAIYAGLAELLRTEYTIAYRSNAQEPDGTLIELALRLVRDGQVAGQASLSYRVPEGRGTVPARPPAPLVPTNAAPAAVSVVPAAPPALIGTLGAASAIVLLYAVYDFARRMPGRQRRRLETFVRGLALTAPEHAKRRSIVQRVLVPSFRNVGKPFMRITPSSLIDSSRRRLEHAGEPMGLGPVELLGLQFGMALAGAIVGVMVATLARPEGWLFLPIVAGGGLVGYLLPSIVVDALARSRKAAIRKALPGSLDMLALGVEAGLSLDGAFAQVAHRWSTPLSEEFRSVLLEFQMGRDRRKALHDLGRRTGVPEVTRFTTAVVQADMLGVPLAQVLFEQASEIRVRRRQRAEDLARKAPVKMLFPMVLLIFPALFVVILGPAVPRLLALFELTY
ncbi:MAG TPA: VWA domain-containing protein [Candidatus Limnocylindrales bacterium]|nr:VWA domain-containing protein [Candidatus Limnocylindrales bacterium]